MQLQQGSYGNTTVSDNALLNYGETFVLNGLVERERDKEQTGTPLFQEVLILQHFFKRSITIDYNRQVLPLVTVRRLVNSDEEIAKARKLIAPVKAAIFNVASCVGILLWDI